MLVEKELVEAEETLFFFLEAACAWLGRESLGCLNSSRIRNLIWAMVSLKSILALCLSRAMGSACDTSKTKLSCYKMIHLTFNLLKFPRER